MLPSARVELPKLEPLADGTGFRVRVRYCGTRSRIRIAIPDRDQAAACAVALIALGEALTDATQDVELAAKLLARAGEGDARELAQVQSTVAKLTSGGLKLKRSDDSPRAKWTVRDLGDAWTTGKLAKEFPDQIKARRAVGNDISRLKGHVYPVIGDVRVSALTLADVERVMASLTGKRPTQRKLSALTRRTIALTLNRLLAIAVYPLKLITSNPIPKGLAPKAGKRRAMAYLYPDEDRALMACEAVPLRERLFWGFLVREGCRVSEALGLRWADLDLERGAVRLERNKTDDPRAWALAPGVAAALTHFRGEPGALVFEPPADPMGLAEVLRGRLREAGVTRAELHTATAERLALRAHDLRGSFVTIALANGRSESWVSDRTGHRSSQMLARYKRAARTAAELDLGDWTPLDVALGLAKPSPPPSGAKRARGASRGRGASRLRDSNRDRLAPPIRFERTTLALGIRSGDPEASEGSKTAEKPDDAEQQNSLSQSCPDPIEAAIAEAIGAAARAGQWATVDALVAELATRRRARNQ